MIDYHPTITISTDIKSVKELVKKGEGARLEFKLKTNHPEKIVKEVVAFANTNGGKLLIGVSDDCKIMGLRFADEDSFILQKAIEEYIYPMIDYSIEKVRVEGEYEILVFDIPASPLKPHYVDLDGVVENRKAYVRVEDKSIQASKELREILKGKRKGKDLRFVFGDKERVLMKYLSDNQSITVSEYASITGITKKQASRTLVLLSLTNVIKVIPKDNGEDRFIQVI